jgi:hypothetical protein
MNFFIFFPLSNSVREGELKGVSQEKSNIVQNNKRIKNYWFSMLFIFDFKGL